MNTVSEQSFEKALDRIRELSRSNTELLEALKLLVGEGGDLFSDEAHSKAREAIRKAGR